jgi:hypothetical protein
VHFLAEKGRKGQAALDQSSGALERRRTADAAMASADDAQDDPSVKDVDDDERRTSPPARSASPTPPPPVPQARLDRVLVERAMSGASPPGIASGDELLQGRPESEAEDNARAVENAEERLKTAKPAPAKKTAPPKRKPDSDTESEDPGPQKRRKPKKPKAEPQVVDDSDDSEDRRRANTSRHKPVTSSAIYNAFILNDVRRRFQTLIYVRDGSPVKTLTVHRHLNYKLTLKAAKDAMDPVLYRQFKNAMEIAYKDTSKE